MLLRFLSGSTKTSLEYTASLLVFRDATRFEIQMSPDAATKPANSETICSGDIIQDYASFVEREKINTFRSNVGV